ncbi:MAG: SpoIIIAH-like family protein [Clostridia bacterium]|nr:SpoIIIAH-like family protein [Clostridia bacterium]
MKKGKVFGKSQIAVTVMVLALAAAIWLNMEYSDTSTKYLGEATYVNNSETQSAVVETGAKATEEEDYFTTVKKEREQAREEAIELIEETLKSDKLTDEDKASAVEKTTLLADRMEKEANIESLLKAKGFEKTAVIISDDEINNVVKSSGLTTAQTLQIQDIVTSQTKIPLSNIKIVTVK